MWRHIDVQEAWDSKIYCQVPVPVKLILVALFLVQLVSPFKLRENL